MSDYFTKLNKEEFGPGPSGHIEWMIIQKPTESLGVTQCAVVRANTAYIAWEKASKIITGFDKQTCYCFPNPRLLMNGD